MNISVKDVDDAGWRKLRMEAIKHSMKVGEFIVKACEEHIKHEEEGHCCAVFSRKSAKGRCALGGK